MANDYTPLKKLPPNATDDQIKEVLNHNKSLLDRAMEDVEHSSRQMSWVDNALYAVIACLTIALLFRIGRALWSGEWSSLGAMDIRLSLGWLFGILCALRNKIR